MTAKKTKKDKLLHIKTIVDLKGNKHSVLVYKDYCSYGNMGFRTTLEAREFINRGLQNKGRN